MTISAEAALTESSLNCANFIALMVSWLISSILALAFCFESMTAWVKL